MVIVMEEKKVMVIVMEGVKIMDIVMEVERSVLKIMDIVMEEERKVMVIVMEEEKKVMVTVMEVERKVMVIVMEGVKIMDIATDRMYPGYHIQKRGILQIFKLLPHPKGIYVQNKSKFIQALATTANTHPSDLR